MATTNQLTGGGFQDALGNPLAGGYLEMELSQDAVTSDGTQVASGHIIRINLDASGNVVTSPAQSVWPNDVLTPAGTFYNVSAYTAAGQLVWGPNAQQVLSTPSPFDVGAWIPGAVNILGGTNSITLQTNGVNNGSQSKLNLVAGSNVTLTDDGSGDVTIAASGGGGGGGSVLLSPTTSQIITQPASTIFEVTDANGDVFEMANGVIEMVAATEFAIEDGAGDGIVASAGATTLSGATSVTVSGGTTATLSGTYAVLGGNFLSMKDGQLFTVSNGGTINLSLSSTQGPVIPVEYNGTSGGTVTLNLPNLDSIIPFTGGSIFLFIKRLDNLGSGQPYSLVITPTGGVATIDGAASLTLSNMYGSAILFNCSGHTDEWYVLAKQ